MSVFEGDDGRSTAVRERLRLEADPMFPAAENGIEIAAISGDSLETVQHNHSRYFTGDEVELLAKYRKA